MDVAQDKRNPRITLYAIVVALFALSCAVRIALAWYPKGIGVLPDEIRYLNLASSLFFQGELIERGGLASFQKILYPISLFPAFFFGDAQMRAGAITVLNCLYVSSAVFPAFVLARRLFGEAKTPIVICLVLTLVMPDMCYSMTFLSESVYLPLALWLVACCLVVFEKHGNSKYLWSIGAGLLCYLAYLAKEVALGFALAFLMMMIVRLVVDKANRRENALSLVCFAAALALPFVILKLTLFSGLLNSYNQADPSVLLNPYTVLFTLYAIVMDSMHFAVAFAVFPLLFPLLTWPRLTRRERELYLFCAFSFAFILLAVVYTISIREDLGHTGIRPHVRYVAPIFLPLVFLMVKQVRRCDGIVIVRSPKRFVAACTSLAICVLVIAFTLGSGDYSQGFDSAQYHVMRIMNESFDPLPVNPAIDVSGTQAEDGIYHGSWLKIHPMVWLARLLFCAFLVYGMYALAGRHRRVEGPAVVICIAILMLANNYGMYQYNTAVYRVDQVTVDETCAIEEFIDGLAPDEQVLIVYDDDTSAKNNLMDVYIDNDRLTCQYIKKADFERVIKEDGGDQTELLWASDSTMGDNIFAINGRMCDDKLGISYVVVHAGQLLNLADSCSSIVTPDAVFGYTVYKIDDGSPVRLK